jgi:DNA-binding winged helix-turn-helix (wHTH) protein
LLSRVHDLETVGKQWLRTFAAMDVVLVRWPEERDRREELRRSGRPRLLVLDESVPPPTTLDLLEDWIRLPADDTDVAARVSSLERRASERRPGPPTLDEDGVLRANGRWVALPPVEARLTTALLERFGAVVSRDALARAGWPEGAPGRNALDVHVLRLRRRVDPLGLVIRTVRSRGYVLESGQPSDESDSRQEGVSKA